MQKKSAFLCFIVLFSIIHASSCLAQRSEFAPQSQRTLGEYVVLGWNDLGMHCMNKDYSAFCVLPPFNNAMAHVIRRGDRPLITTQGIVLTYRLPANTYSVGKVNFWNYETPLFGVSLPDNVGLSGNGLSGTLTPVASRNVFEVTGVPITPYDDATPAIEQPYQLMEVTARDSITSALLDQTTFVTPTSVEMNCASCHSRSGYTVEQSILLKHDNDSGTNLYSSRPVLCASCHASNALGTPGTSGLKSLSRAMHSQHSGVSGVTCYSCHPGQQTQCLRGAMFLAGKTCTNCHGTMSQVASSGRRPWIDEPRCSQCHDANHSENAGKLYRNSTGHGGLQCTACHNSPHAELPTAQTRDAVQVQRVQGTSSYISNCTVCHLATPSGAGPHGFRPASAVSRWSVY